LKVTKKETLIW